MSKPNSSPASAPAAAPTPAPAPAPKPAAAPAAPKPAAAKPAAAPKPAAAKPAPASTPSQRDAQGRFVAGSEIRPELPKRPQVSAKKAFKLSAEPGQTVHDLVAGVRKQFNLDSPSRQGVEIPPSALAPAAAEPPPVEAPAPVETPVEETPVAAPAAAPAAPTAPAKFKVGDKEFTAEELAAHLDELARLKNQPAPAPAAAPAPAPAAEPAPTKEEIAAAEAKWIAERSQQLDAPLSEADVEKILEGGPEAVSLFQGLRKRDMAVAILQARKSVAESLNPVLEQIFSAMQPVVQQWEGVQRYQVTQQFLTRHPDFKQHIDMATQVAEELLRRYPEETKRMTPEQMMDEVARQSDLILTNQYKRFNPGATGSWRTTAAPAPAPAPAPAAAPAGDAAPAPAPAPAPRPLAATPPAGQPATPPTNWQKSIAHSMRGR